MRVLYFISFSLVIAMTLTMSCGNENSGGPDCDGTLAVVVSASEPQTVCSPADGSITVSGSGGTAPYKFSINGGAKQTSATFGNLSKGTYSITIFDKNGCEASISSVEILFPTSTLDFEFVASPDNDCLSNNGAISITATGGTSYTYSKDNGVSFQASNSFSSLEPKSYSVVVKNANGCTITKSVLVEQGNTNTSFSGIIKPIITNNCATSSNCHGSGVTDRPDFTVDSNIKSKASLIKTKTANGSMPKNGWSGLTASEIDEIKKQIACWVADGAPTNN